MNQVNWLDVFNSATTFFVLFAIALGIWVLIMHKTFGNKKPPKH
jgi:hypothetical protein